MKKDYLWLVGLLVIVVLIVCSVTDVEKTTVERSETLIESDDSLINNYDVYRKE